MTDSTANGECCRHAAELREEITSAIGLAEQLVSLLLTEARQAQGRPALHVVGLLLDLRSLSGLLRSSTSPPDGRPAADQTRRRGSHR